MDLEKAEIILPTSIGPSKSTRVPENVYHWFTDYVKAFDHNKLENSERDGLPVLEGGRRLIFRSGHGDALLTP